MEDEINFKQKKNENDNNEINYNNNLNRNNAFENKNKKPLTNITNNNNQTKNSEETKNFQNTNLNDIAIFHNIPNNIINNNLNESDFSNNRENEFNNNFENLNVESQSNYIHYENSPGHLKNLFIIEELIMAFNKFEDNNNKKEIIKGILQHLSNEYFSFFN
jgi:hypothetical protein